MTLQAVYSIVGALAAAMSFAVAAVLQQEATQTVGEEHALNWRLLLDLVRRPKWLIGTAMLIAGFVLQAIALAFGPVALVQPIVVTELAFAIPLAIWRRRRHPGLREWTGIVLVLGGIAAFLVIAQPATGIGNPGALTWALCLAPVGLIVAVAIAAAIRAQGPMRAVLLGAVAGLSFGVLAVLTKAVTYLVRQSQAVISWQLLAVVGVGLFAFVISQSAYQAGPLAYSMPLVAVLEPLVAVVIGDLAFEEEVQLSSALLSLELLAAVIAVVGVVLLTTSPVVLSIYEDARVTKGGEGIR